MKQDGYAAIVAVFILLGVAGTWFGGQAIITTGANRNIVELSDARDALLHYAVSYIDHYGPRGAGLGHLPCPDTDPPSDALSDPWRLDGPNPPCARLSVQTGWLPRHVNVTDGRYHFHTRKRQRILYAVSGKFVNNPLGRVVNANTNGDIQLGSVDDVIAILAIPKLEEDSHAIPRWFEERMFSDVDVTYTIIRGQDIQRHILQRASAWLVGQMNRALEVRCNAQVSNEKCVGQLQKSDECVFSSDKSLQHWLYTATVAAQCEDYIAMLSNAFNELESVPFNQHWFVRNQWHDYFSVFVDDTCSKISDTKCQFQVVQHHDESEQYLEVSEQALNSAQIAQKLKQNHIVVRLQPVAIER